MNFSIFGTPCEEYCPKCCGNGLTYATEACPCVWNHMNLHGVNTVNPDCPTCKGLGRRAVVVSPPQLEQCSTCKGFCKVPTAFGKELLKFIKTYEGRNV